MHRDTLRQLLTLAMMWVAGANWSYSQTADYPFPSLSPQGSITQVIGFTTVQISYEIPAARGRKVFGELVPWDKLWRTGAGHCTKLRVSSDVQIARQTLSKGTYALLTIPNKDNWTVILNSDTTLYGTSGYNAALDVMRFETTNNTSARYYESLNFDIDFFPNNALVHLAWENTYITFDITTTTDAEVEAFIQDQLLTDKVDNSDTYAGAVEYLIYQNSNPELAITLAKKALTIDNSNGWARDMLIRLYEQEAMYQEALDEIEIAREFVMKSSEPQNNKDKELKHLDQQKSRIQTKM